MDKKWIVKYYIVLLRFGVLVVMYWKIKVALFLFCSLMLTLASFLSIRAGESDWKGDYTMRICKGVFWNSFVTGSAV